MNLITAIILEVVGFIFLDLISLGIIYAIACDDYNCEKRLPKEAAIAMMIFSFVVAIACVISVIFTSRSYNESYENIEYEIYSLDRGTEVTGHFSLGCGSIDSDITYYFYVETDRGFELKSISSDNSKIYLVETGEKSPSIVTKKDKDSFGTYKVIYVPVGTVVKSFTG